MAKKSFWKKALDSIVWAVSFILNGILKILLAAGKFVWGLLAIIAAALAGTISKGVQKAREKGELAASAKPGLVELTELRAFEGTAGEFEDWLNYSKSTVGIVLGARGSGKTGLGLRLLENWAASGRKVCAMGFQDSSLAPWIKVVSAIDEAPNGSAVLVDEGGMLFNSRDSMTKGSKLLSQLLFVSRHKDLSLLFISQNSANLEINAVRQADYLLLKPPSLLQNDFERGKIGKIYEQVGKDFTQLKADRGLLYVYSDKFRGFASNQLPSFWGEGTSKAFAKTSLAKR
jgi:hypothetical protein